MTRTSPFYSRSPVKAREAERHKRLLLGVSNATGLFALPVIVIVAIIMLGAPSWQNLLTLINLGMIVVISYIARRLAESGRTELGSYVLLISFLIIVGFNSLMIPEIFILIGAVYAVIVVMGGLLTPDRGVYVIAACAGICWVVVWLILSANVLEPNPIDQTLASIMVNVIIVLVFLFTAFTSQLATRDLRQSLDDATYDLVQANRELEKASQLKSQFTARTSHELRTPLSAIIVFTDLSLRGAYGPINEKQRESLERVLTNGRRLEALINDLLDLSRIEAGELQIRKGPFEVKKLVDNVESILESKAQKKNLKFSTHIAPDMPDYVEGDENRLIQVLTNLTENAIKFTETGAVEVVIQPKGSSRWQMIVKDTGRGILEENHKVIFEEFTQGIAARDTKTQGTGLGLAITNNLVQMMNGTIDVESEIGKGSTFTVTLPLSQ